jgi:recyclin-1
VSSARDPWLDDSATSQMGAYKPAEHEATSSVAPLLQFFELVHVGDTIQSMVQVFFDQELSPYVDKTDFLNAVMREKKRFEAVLDDAVAAGLNAGIEVLMNQVEHIIQVKTGPREYYPDESKPMELGPTEGCREAIACLETHCDLLRGSTQKEVLEVFYQEVGIRLQA